MNTKTITLYALLLLSTLSATAKTIRVLAVGNSFSEDAVEQYLYELAAAQGDSLIIGNAYIPGCTIDRHYDNLRGDSAVYAYRKIVGGVRAEHKKTMLKTIIRDEQWDIITLQQASQYAGIPASFVNLPLLKRLIQSYTTNLHVEFVWHMTWAYADDYTAERFSPYGYNQRRMYYDIISTMLNVLPGVGIRRIIPTGTAIQLMRRRMGNVLNRDGYHLSYTIGRYTAACTWCEYLTGRSVDGNPYYPDTITEQEAQVCQQEAHEACYMQRHNSYVIL